MVVEGMKHFFLFLSTIDDQITCESQVVIWKGFGSQLKEKPEALYSMKGYRAHHNAYHNEPEEGSPGPNMSLDLCSDQRVDKQPKSQAEEGKKGNKAQYYLAHKYMNTFYK